MNPYLRSTSRCLLNGLDVFLPGMDVSRGISGCTDSQCALYLDPELQPVVIGRYRGIHATWLFSFYRCEVVRAASLYSHVVGTFVPSCASQPDLGFLAHLHELMT